MGLNFGKFRELANASTANRFMRATTPNEALEAKAKHVVQRILDSGVTPSHTRQELDRIQEEQAQYEREYYERDEIGYDQSTHDYDDSFKIPLSDESGLVDPTITLDESQVAAIDMLCEQNYGCLIGSAGTGKTTSQRFFLQRMIYGNGGSDEQLFKVKKLSGRQGLNIALIAYTGMATQVIKLNMPSWLHPCCKTIHSLLEFAPVTSTVINVGGELKEKMVFMPQRTAENKLDVDIILIDEASMLGVDLWHMLLDACHDDVKIFMVGDLNQLPPVGQQSIFAYALAEWPVAELTHIHRQKEEAANKIIDVAQAILRGKEFTFDDPMKNPNWRVIGFELNNDPIKAGMEIVNIANQLRKLRIHSSVDPTMPAYYDPHRDRIITAGNGYDLNNSIASVQQFAINEALSKLIEPPTDEHPVFVIDAGRSTKHFSVNHIVMATKNESPDEVDRVTNGMTGVILNIRYNNKYMGNPKMVGPEQKVAKYQRDVLSGRLAKQAMDFDLNALTSLDTTVVNEKTREGQRPASHIVTVKFHNGATREFSTQTQIDSLQLAYASTCHKCQGSQFETAIIIVHHVAKSQLSREWFYTGVTRAQKRVVMLYTKNGIRLAMAKQRIFGNTLAEKIKRYQMLAEESAEMATLFGKEKKAIRLYV